MGKIINTYILPHPPIIVPGVGKGREKQAAATVEAAQKVALEIAKDRPTTIVLSSPHAPCFADHAYISNTPRLLGNLAAFDCPEVSLDFENNLKLVSLITEKAQIAGISAGGLKQPGQGGVWNP